jgi:starch-binding outer membrane protein, SusD/RagB family
MQRYTTIPTNRVALRRAMRPVLGAAVALALTACESPTEILELEDPDIINPSDVQSAAGANAVRLGALNRLNAATSGLSGTVSGTTPNTGNVGTESLLMLGGLLADEWNNGDTFIDRHQVDQRSVALPAHNTFLTTANRALHRARLSAEQAIDLLEQFAPSAPAWQVAEMHFVQAYVINLMAEHYCNGLAFSSVVNGAEQYGTPMTTQAAFQQALQHADDGLALITGTTADDQRVRSALQVTRGRILLNLDRAADAAAAVAGVQTTFRYRMLHSPTTRDNAIWTFNNSARRYSVSTAEGANGLDFATANDPRIPTCQGGDATCRTIGVTQTRRDDNTSALLFIQRLWPARDSSVVLVSGVEARLIEAEAQLATDPVTALNTLNALRTATGTGSGGVAGLTPLVDAGSQTAREDQLFRERAFWLFGRGHRLGDLRRLIRDYGRTAATVFPTGAWHKGGSYGTDVNLPLPEAERNNPNMPQTGLLCTDRNA